MDLGTVFKLSLYGLIALVGVILGAAEGEGAIAGNTRTELFLPYLSLPVVLCGYFFTERHQRGLNAVWANSLGIVALIATAYQFNSENREGKLLAGTHLLLYVTWIVLFQKKTVRSYWFLLALGILQLAIASVLTKSGWFGFTAIGYMFGAVWTLSIFSLWRAEQLFEENPPTEFPLPDPNEQQPTSEVHGSVRHEDGAYWLTARFVTGVLTMTVSALIVSAAFFAFIPRVWVGPDFSFNEDRVSSERMNPRSVMATTVRLGDLGPILESKERVFEMQLTNLITNQIIPVQDYAELLGLAEPLFRGVVLTNYDNGRWTSAIRLEHRDAARNLREGNYSLRQDFRIEQSSSRLLYCLGKPLEVTDSERRPIGTYHPSTGVLYREDTAALDYFVFSKIPEPQPYFVLKVWNQDRRILDQCQKLPVVLTALKKLAIDIVEKERARRQRGSTLSERLELTQLEMAEAIEFHLRDSGEYYYSLDTSITDPKRDPIEDFLFNRKAGHCEYFATALALMLRAVDIPARIVTGFKGGVEHPTKRNYNFEVQQRFAHVWVEAWVEQNKSGWTTFDATPVDGRANSIASVEPKKNSVWSDMQSALTGLWSENVLNMSLDRQEKSIYKPLREFGYSLATFFRQLFTSPNLAWETLRELLSNREQWFSVGGGLLAFLILIFVAGFLWLARFCGRCLFKWLTTRANRHAMRTRRIVDFYERFARLMRTRGLQRDPTQTQREFADRIETALRPELSSNELAKVPQQISQLFYRVRFGDEDLTPDELHQLESSLRQLEHALTNEGQRR